MTDWSRCFIHVKSQFWEKIWEYLSLVLSRNVITLQHLIIKFLFNDLSAGPLWEVKNKRKFQIFSSKSGHGRL